MGNEPQVIWQQVGLPALCAGEARATVSLGMPEKLFWPVADVTCCWYFEERVQKSLALVKQAAR